MTETAIGLLIGAGLAIAGMFIGMFLWLWVESRRAR